MKHPVVDPLQLAADLVGERARHQHAHLLLGADIRQVA